MWRRLSQVAALITTFAVSDSLMAQATPSDRAKAFFDALAARSWDTAAMLVHPERRVSFRDEQLVMMVGRAEHEELIRQAERQGRSSGMVAYTSDGILRPEHLAKHARMRVPGFGDATTLAAVAALTPDEFMSRFLEASVLELDSMVEPGGDRTVRRIVGEVVESPSLAHVLYRLNGPSVQLSDSLDVEILRLRSSGGEWFIWPLHTNFDFTSGMHLHLPDMPDEGRPPDD